MPRRHSAVLRRTSQGWRVTGPATVHGCVRPPADKSLFHRALILAALASGTSRLRGVPGQDVLRTVEALRHLGVPLERKAEHWRVQGVGLNGLRPSREALDCGNSGTTMRLLAGLLAAQPFVSRLIGDASLQRRPMRRVALPLRAMGAQVEAAGSDGRPPLQVGRNPERPLQGCAHHLSVDSAQVRSALLLAGLYADGPTRVTPASAARDHTERMLQALGVRVQGDADGTWLYPHTAGSAWAGFTFDLPGDASAAAFFVALVASLPHVALRVDACSLNPSRVRYLDVLRRAGARIIAHVDATALNEPVGRLQIQGGRLSPLALAGDDVVACLDEIPALALAAAAAGTALQVRDAAELRVKESDRIEALADVLGRFGAVIRTRRDGFDLHAGTRLHAAEVDSHGDHRIAMVAALLATRCHGTSVIRDVDCVATSYPDFVSDLHALLQPVAS